MTSRISVFEAIKAWRKNRTTIVITHDLSQIGSQDFVYVMKQGFRSDLVALEGGEFGRMASVQAVNPVPEDQAERWHDAEDIVEILEGEDVETMAAARRPRPSSTASLRPGSVGYLAYIDVLAEYANRDSFVMPPSRISKQVATSNTSNRVSLVQRKQSTSARSKGSVHHASVLDIPEENRPTSRLSGLLDPARISLMSHRLSYLAPPVDNHRREHRVPSWIATSPEKRVSEVDIKIANHPDEETAAPAKIRRKFQSVTRLIWYLFPGVPKKYMMAAGVVFSIGHGVLTPFWSKYIAVLMAHVSIGGTDSHGLAITAATVAAISAADGFSIFGQFFFLDYLSADWSTLLRLQAFDNVVKQPQAWFDRRENAASRLLQILIKDADDMRPLMSTVVGQFFTVSVMLGVGLGWAMAIGWRITLVGVALAPVFALAFALGAYFINKLEACNKTAREDLSRMFYEVRIR
jgi:ATP-binding cassette subfamily B (MDR/TAP) protein 1